MKITESFSLAISNIFSSKMRSFLTMLGIIFGIAAVMVIVGLGNGMEGYITDSFASFGTNVMTVSITGSGSSGTVKEEDMYAIVEENPAYFEYISPTVFMRSSVKIGSDTLRTLGYADKKIRLVLNRSNAKTRIGIEDVQKLLKQEFYYVIPNDFQAASQSIIDGKPLVLEHQDIALSDAIRGLVGLYSNRSLGGVEEPVRGEHKSSLFGRLFG